MARVLGRRDPPADVRAISGLDKADYVDFFVMTTAVATDRSVEEWARAVVEAVPLAGRIAVWRVVCGLRLDSRPSTNSIGGWRIGERGDDWLRIEARSWFLTAHIVFNIAEDTVSFATFIRYDHPAAMLIWPPVSIAHRQVVPQLLRQAEMRLH